ncbi:MAG: GNAT family N-acetyltransferase [archaeon]|nr:GNAT family N-acetyltransferase [archaeon]MDD2477358.1 GNAT family N-acetyltransferase [Candidatus ainarchaeum sp.]MDD3084529.1 GNAT family N-acetyltransferase [Candidatus ainarchaeum sp.]MDD4220810.1 GNAT family N-acetyltransferase [Candidatus ainarchaeum sp.]MDD4662309.1 GNAT family N-acetyltransferase [Candidatus ainarchaeum sp.]
MEEKIDIYYKKINFENRKELNLELLSQMHEIDKIFVFPKKSYIEILKDYLKSKKYNFYFVINKKNKDLIGGAFGELRERNTFFLDKLFVNPNYEDKGFGTKLLLRVVSDLRVNHKIESIMMMPKPRTKSINRRITGLKPIKINIDGEIKKIIRKFNSNFKYSLEKHQTIPNIEIIKIKKNDTEKAIVKKEKKKIKLKRR